MTDKDDARVLKTVTDTYLLEGLMTADNKTVWEQFVNRYRPMIVRYARRFGLGEADAQDVAQQALIAFCTAYQAGKYERDKGRLRLWLFGIAKNHMRNAVKRARRREVQVVGEPDQTDFFARIEDDDALSRVWEEEWQQAILRQCLEEVRREFEPQSVEAFELFAWKQWPAQKVADHLGITPNAVFIAKHRIMKRLRELLPAMSDIW